MHLSVYASRPEACFRLEKITSKIVSIKRFDEKSVNEYISKAFEGVSDRKMLTSELQSLVRKN